MTVARDLLAEPRNVAVPTVPDAAAYRRWAQAVDGTDVRLWVQLNHPGRQSPRYLSRQPVAPSEIERIVAGAGLGEAEQRRFPAWWFQ